MPDVGQPAHVSEEDVAAAIERQRAKRLREGKPADVEDLTALRLLGSAVVVASEDG